MIFIAQGILLAVLAAAYGAIHPHRPWRLVKGGIFGLNVTIVTFMITTFIVNKTFVYRWPHGPRFWASLVALTLTLGVVFGTISWALGKARRCSTPQAGTLRAGTIVLRVVASLVGALTVGYAALAFFVPRWFADYFGSLTADQFVFLITSGQGDSTAEANANVANYMVAPVLMCAILGAQIGFWFARRAVRVVCLVVSLALCAASTVYAFNTLPLAQIGTSEFSSSDYLENNYVDPYSTVSFPEHKRNLIHIYMESIENSFYDQASGGYDDRNLMPDLMAMTQANISFSDQPAGRMGGPHQTFGSSHSLAAMVNMESGVPMMTRPRGGKEEAAYSDLPTLGDLLHEQGYTNEIILGSDGSWGDLDRWYKRHGDFMIFDWKHAKKVGLIPEDYNVWWGYEDDKLYDYAKDELTRLASEDKPFYVIVENADTHFPDGYKSERITEEPFDEQYANVIFYSQAEVVRFVEWCQAQPWYANTTILVTGDHRSMDKTFFADWDPNYERTIVNFYLNSAVQPASADRTVERSYAPFDFFPTNRAGLGTNLFSNLPTLVEQSDVDTVNTELSKRSSFYFDYKRPER